MISKNDGKEKRENEIYNKIVRKKKFHRRGFVMKHSKREK